MFDQNYYNFFIENKSKFDIYETIALERVIKYYKNVFNLVEICNNYKYDFMLSNNKKYEVKADLASLKTGNFYIEYYDNFNKKPSGIDISESNHYIITDTNDNYYMIKTKKLKKICPQFRSIVNLDQLLPAIWFRFP